MSKKQIKKEEGSFERNSKEDIKKWILSIQKHYDSFNTEEERKEFLEQCQKSLDSYIEYFQNVDGFKGR